MIHQLESAAKQMELKKDKDTARNIQEEIENIRLEIPEDIWESLEEFKIKSEEYRSGTTSYTVRNKNSCKNY